MKITFTAKQVSERGTFGKVATEALARVADNGQVGFNVLSLKAFVGLRTRNEKDDGWNPTYAIYGNDVPEAGSKRKATWIQFRAVPTPANGKLKLKGMDTALELKQLAKIGWSKDGKSGYVAMAKDFETIGYNFKDSGSQSFKCEVDEAAHTVTFQVPVGALAKKEVKTRKRKAETSKANGLAKVPAAQVQQATEDLEMELDA